MTCCGIRCNSKFIILNKKRSGFLLRFLVRKALFLGAWYLFSPSLVSAIEPAAWLQGSYPWRVTPHLRLITEPELRIESGVPPPGRSLGFLGRDWYVERLQTDLWADYRWKNKGSGWDAGLAGGWRLALRNGSGGVNLRPRWMMDARVGRRLGAWSLDYRLRWQQQFSDFGGSVPDLGRSYGRHKVSLGLRLGGNRSLDWSEEFWVPVPGPVPGLKAWNPGIYDHRRSTVQFRWKEGGSTWSVGFSLDRDRMFPGQSEPQAILRLGHQRSVPGRSSANAAGSRPSSQ